MARTAPSRARGDGINVSGEPPNRPEASGNSANVSLVSGHFCGSTLLSIILGNHRSAVSIGEVHKLFVETSSGRSCTCGAAFHLCEFWSPVLRQFGARHGLGAPGRSFARSSLLFVDRNTLAPGSGLLTRRLVEALVVFGGARTLHRASAFSAHLRRNASIGRNILEIVELVREHHGASIVVDTSKGSIGPKLLYASDPARFRGIFLVRDGRAAVESWVRKTGVTVEAAAGNWLRSSKSRDLIRRFTPRRVWCDVRYETLCESPDAEVRRICGFLGIPFEQEMLDISSRTLHNIAGNPMRRNERRRQIKLDLRWKENLDRRDLDTFDRVAGRYNRKIGYLD